MAIAMELVTRSLQQCEQVIERGLTTFVEVGQALMEIRDGRLYREQGYGTFEDYCQQRWHWTRKVGYEYIRAAEVAANVTSTLQSPISLTQAVQLAPEREYVTLLYRIRGYDLPQSVFDGSEVVI